MFFHVVLLLLHGYIIIYIIQYIITFLNDSLIVCYYRKLVEFQTNTFLTAATWEDTVWREHKVIFASALFPPF